jgi:hypothetical protein
MTSMMLTHNPDWCSNSSSLSVVVEFDRSRRKLCCHSQRSAGEHWKQPAVMQLGHPLAEASLQDLFHEVAACSRTLGNALLLSSLFVFTVGLLSSELFPRDPFTQPDICKNDQKPAAADSPFDRVIFSLIDALRLDSVYGGPSGLGFTQKA